MFVGGCAGSTGGGLKVTRVVTLVKAAFMDMRKMIHPNAVVNVRMEGRAMPEKQVRGVQAYFSVYMLLYAVSWLLLSLNGFDLLSTFTALSACINNIGPGLGMVGPTGNFSAFAPWAKLLLSFDMLRAGWRSSPCCCCSCPPPGGGTVCGAGNGETEFHQKTGRGQQSSPGWLFR